ncbi:hypothetical protein PVAND_008576 [Polypedilum vanderplanki]|uniref:RNA helicase n=1 Tax=Polypedilum vanderplanki TaxID=319348 RepID=A0A9J6CAE2_POLVA|nr:hypothetical protein PVAND_008576 [Polypedilum vanderplanki]
MDNSKQINSTIENKSVFCYGFMGDPIKNAENLKFSENVRLSFLKKYKLTSAIQSYSWNIILERKSLLMIGPRGCGKTIGFLPCLLSLLEMDKEFITKRAMIGGPFAILFCNSPNEVTKIKDLICNKFAKITNLKIKTTTGSWESEKKKIAFAKGCDLLITTISSFNQLLDVEDTMIFDHDKIKYMVFDNFSDMYEESDKQVARIFKQFITCEPAENSKVQLIITSSKWLEKLRSLFIFSHIKIMLINSFIETAIMARSYFIVYIMNEDDKNMKLLEILNKQNWLYYKTIMIFKDLREMEEFKEFAKHEDPKICIEFITIRDNENFCATKDLCRIWEYEPNGKMSILLMTDEVYQEQFENLDFIHTIIHYSLTSTWTDFDFRFAASTSHFKRYITKREIPNSLDAPRSIIFLNDDDIQKYPRLYEFLTDRRLFHELFDDVKEKVTMTEVKFTENSTANITLSITPIQQLDTVNFPKPFISDSQNINLSDKNIPNEEINEAKKENEIIENNVVINYSPFYIEWSQDESHIKLKMQPIDVIADYAFCVSRRSFDITLKYAEDYAMKSFDFFARVDPKFTKHELKNNVLLIILTKAFPSIWFKLTKLNDKMYFIKPSETEQLREINSVQTKSAMQAPFSELSRISFSKLKPACYLSSSEESDY